MAQIRPEPPAEEEAPRPSRKALRYGIPLGIAGVTALTVGLMPALAQGDDGLDDVSAEELITRVLDSDAQSVQGTVKLRTDLGLPALPGGLGSGSGDDADPGAAALSLLSGDHTLRVAADGPDRQKATLLDQGGHDYTALHDGGDVWAFSTGSDKVFHGTNADAAAEGDEDHALPEDMRDLTPRELARELLQRSGDTTDVTVDGTVNVAGREAYQLKVTPTQDASTVKDVRIAVAENGVPLKFTLTADDDTKVVDVAFTRVSFAKPSADTFAYKPPAGADVTTRDLSQRRDTGRMPELAKGDVETHGSGWTTVGEVKLPDGALGEDGARSFLDALTKKTDEGRLFSTPLVNALVTDDGRVFFGAVHAGELNRTAAAN
ncbi:hypothetical protein SRB5_35400 [Streptomyces sp. RB5]|uniref:MucB/RseB N-terminal domain-containing protein n=1 Tax=Streptomyces smaragdinus TaxID=2585196 RepID=A0A7K0CK53_9ACTN|nr:hypothetical protein [Streptomyces smaragdinus]MQY13392.1 hypothetical protein [Streptomyces smaragdinus]